MSLLADLNQRYLALHLAKEESFWKSRMGLTGYQEGSYERDEASLMAFTTDSSHLTAVRKALEATDLAADEKLGLEGWQSFFVTNVVEDPQARAIQNQLIDLEGVLEDKRAKMALGYNDPKSGDFVAASSVALSLQMATASEEAMRRSAWEGLRQIEPFVIENGFLEIVRQRNRLAKLLGYEDYYDYRVQTAEGFSKQRLFEILDELEVETRDACQRVVDELAQEKGAAAKEPWNFSFFAAGDLTQRFDPYFRFNDAVDIWGRSFAALGIDYGGATLTLDLLDRVGKFENGFMHGPRPAYRADGKNHPATINFTANAIPGQLGSGRRAIMTLFHEGGHAAHFSNIRMPSPAFAIEFPPTSVAFAETQSMFLDSLTGDSDWRLRYAHNAEGQPPPPDLMREDLILRHRHLPHGLRHMLMVCYAEKALYEMSDDQLTADNVLATIRNVEKRLTCLASSGRPVLSIPHLLSGSSSAYYHGYVLAKMAVYQTRSFFLERDGFLTDNPKIGPDLAQTYWSPGNAKGFLDLVEALTGRPFSANDTIKRVNRSDSEVLAEAEKMVTKSQARPATETPVALNASIQLIHGDEVISSCEMGHGRQDDASFTTMAQKYADWIASQTTASSC